MKHTYTLIFYFFFVSVFSAQVTISLPTVSVKAGENVIVYSRLTTKDSLSALQFTLKWDPTVLQYVSADSLSLPLTSGLDNFGTRDIDNGLLRFLWTTPNKPFATTIDSLKLFRLVFKTNSVTAKSALAVVDVPVRFKAVNAGLADLAVKHIDGQVSVMKPNATNDLLNSDNFKLYSVFPNPFNSRITVPYYIGTAGTLRLEIFSVVGEKVFSEVKRCVVGYEKEYISLEGAPSGTYIIRACHDSNCLIQKILKE